MQPLQVVDPSLARGREHGDPAPFGRVPQMTALDTPHALDGTAGPGPSGWHMWINLHAPTGGQSRRRIPSRWATASASIREVRTQGAQHPPDVVADGVDAEVELCGDLRGGVTVREQVQDLVLARREVRVR